MSVEYCSGRVALKTSREGRLKGTKKPEGRMAGTKQTADLINDFLGGMHVLASAIGGVMEDALLKEFAATELTIPQLKLLKLVATSEAQSIGDIAAFLGVSNAAASKAADRMVRRKLLRRAEGDSDRRTMLLTLTEAGRRIVQTYESARNKKLEKVFRHFEPGELRQTAAVMERLAVAIVSQSANPEDVCLQCKMYFREKCLMREISRHECFYVRYRSRDMGRGAEVANGRTRVSSRQRAEVVTSRQAPGQTVPLRLRPAKKTGTKR